MRKFSFLLSMPFMISLSAQSPKLKLIPPSYFVDDYKGAMFNWSDVEEPNGDSFKDFMISAVNRNNPGTYDTLPEYYHVVNLSNDGFIDLIYNGPIGDEGYIGTEIFYGSGSTLINAGYDYRGSVKQVFMENGQIVELVIIQFPCCASVSLLEHYLLYSSSSFKLEPIYHRVRNLCLEAPKMYFDNPIDFKVVNDGYRLREKPNYENGNCVIDPIDGQTYDNILATFKPGVIGKAHGFSKDKEGDIWWLVEMATDDASVLNRDIIELSEKGEHVLGWMNSKYLEEMKE